MVNEERATLAQASLSFGPKVLEPVRPPRTHIASSATPFYSLRLQASSLKTGILHLAITKGAAVLEIWVLSLLRFVIITTAGSLVRSRFLLLLLFF